MSNSGLVAADAVHTLYSSHHRWLQGWLRAKLGNSFDAADLAQDTFLRVLRHRHELDALREPRAYLTTIAKRLMLNHHRKRSLEQAYMEALAYLPAPQTPSVEQGLILLQTLHEIDEMLSGLSAVAKQAFLLAQLDGLTYPEIASKLNVSVRSVQRYIVQGYEQCIMLVH